MELDPCAAFPGEVETGGLLSLPSFFPTLGSTEMPSSVEDAEGDSTVRYRADGVQGNMFPFSEEKEILINDRCPHYLLSTLQTKCFTSFTPNLTILPHGVLAEVLPIWSFLCPDIFHDHTIVENPCGANLVAFKSRG